MSHSLIKMHRYDGAHKVLHVCPTCRYCEWLPEPVDSRNCPMCDGSIKPPKPDIDMSRTVSDVDSLLSKFGL